MRTKSFGGIVLTILSIIGFCVLIGTVFKMGNIAMARADLEAFDKTMEQSCTRPDHKGSTFHGSTKRYSCAFVENLTAEEIAEFKALREKIEAE